MALTNLNRLNFIYYYLSTNLFMKVSLTAWHMEDVQQLVKIANSISIWQNVRDSFPHPYTKKDATEWITAHQGKTSLENSAVRVDGSLCGGIFKF